MTVILFVAVLILGMVLSETRKRLVHLERALYDMQSTGRLERWRAIVPEADAAATQRAEAGATEPSAPMPEPVMPQPADQPVPFRGPTRIAAQARRDTDDAKAPSESLAEPTPAQPADAASLRAASEPVDAPDRPRAIREPESEDNQQSTGFEDLFGRRLPIWAGGVTLLVAAVLLVKYSIDSGLLSPWVRVMLGLIFGAGLIAAAEIARRMERFVQDERVAQSLAGAGVGALYAATLAGANLYHIVAPATAFAGLSVITLVAMGLALRFGAPCAVLALAGGLATPALVQSGAPNVPLLSGYLAMVIGSLTVLSRRQRWFWLGAMALAGGMGWTALVILMGELSQFSILSIGLLVLLLGIAFPILTAQEDRGIILHATAAAAAALQLALLVSQGGYDALSWGLYGLLSLAFLWLTSRLASLRPMIVLPLGASLVLAYLWPSAPLLLFGATVSGIVLMFGGCALWRLWRPGGTIIEAGQVVAIGIGGYFVALHQHYGATDAAYATLGVAFAALPALGAFLGWRSAERQADWRFPALALASGFLLIWAAFFGFEDWLQPVAIAAVSAALLLIAFHSRYRRISNGALVYLGGALLLLIVTGALNHEVDRLVQSATAPHPGQALIRWSLLAIAFGAFAWRHAGRAMGKALTAVTSLLAYGCVAQFVPAAWLAIAAATGLLGLALIARRQFTDDLVPAMVALGGVSLLWMAEPIGQWLLHALASQAGVPMLSSDLPASGLVLRRLIVPVLLGCGSFWMLHARIREELTLAMQAAIAIPALVGIHCLYKLIFAIDGTERFIAFGVAERTLWEMLLIGAGLALWHWAKQSKAALLMAGLGFAHNLFYTLFLHNPLWSEQAVGAWPLANLLLPCFGIAFAAPQIMGRMLPGLGKRVARQSSIWHMAVMLLFAFASLRQLFGGTIFALAPVGQVESIFWSVLAIAMAIGWLLWGIRRGAHSWRIGSLVLMLAAIAKVFLIDAAGLEGLLRVASFLALGFSLIGIGWLYSRFLRNSAN